MKKPKSPALTAKQQENLLKLLKKRFEDHMNRHKGLDWTHVRSRLMVNSEKLFSLNEMEKTGGEPDVVGYNKHSGEFIFMDCSAESPVGRRSLCYDRAALDSRKEHKPRSTVMDVASEMGIEVLNEDEYRKLQSLGKFDAKTSSWLKTPVDIRNQGGAIFGDFRFGQVFIYHNGAESYYAARGFRGLLRV